eukprot:c27305_g1_i2 orf=603-818(+)
MHMQQLFTQDFINCQSYKEKQKMVYVQLVILLQLNELELDKHWLLHSQRSPVIWSSKHYVTIKSKPPCKHN